MSPTLFNVNVDDLENAMPNNLSIKTCKYADDCTQDEIVALGSTSHMQKLLETSEEWAVDNRMRINPKKTEGMWICFNSAILTPALLTLDGAVLERVNSYKLLGVLHRENLKWNSHVKAVVKKANKRLFCLREWRRASLPYEAGLTCYRTMIRPILEYAAPIGGGLPDYLMDEIEQVQNRCLKILGLPQNELQTLKEGQYHYERDTKNY